jgi:hypothetical protein
VTYKHRAASWPWMNRHEEQHSCLIDPSSMLKHQQLLAMNTSFLDNDVDTYVNMAWA